MQCIREIQACRFALALGLGIASIADVVPGKHIGIEADQGRSWIQQICRIEIRRYGSSIALQHAVTARGDGDGRMHDSHFDSITDQGEFNLASPPDAQFLPCRNRTEVITLLTLRGVT